MSSLFLQKKSIFRWIVVVFPLAIILGCDIHGENTGMSEREKISDCQRSLHSLYKYCVCAKSWRLQDSTEETFRSFLAKNVSMNYRDPWCNSFCCRIIPLETMDGKPSVLLRPKEFKSTSSQTLLKSMNFVALSKNADGQFCFSSSRESAFYGVFLDSLVLVLWSSGPNGKDDDLEVDDIGIDLSYYVEMDEVRQ